MRFGWAQILQWARLAILVAIGTYGVSLLALWAGGFVPIAFWLAMLAMVGAVLASVTAVISQVAVYVGRKTGKRRIDG